MTTTCGETMDLLLKASVLGVVSFVAYNWLVKEGITQGRWASRGVKYLKGRMV